MLSGLSMLPQILLPIMNLLMKIQRIMKLIYIPDDYLVTCYPIKYLGEDITKISALYEKICLNSENRMNEKSGMNKNCLSFNFSCNLYSYYSQKKEKIKD